MDEDFEFMSPKDTGLPRTEEDVVPRVTSLEDFELCRAIKEKGKMTGEFQVVEANEMELKMSGLSGWEVLFVQFRDKKSGELVYFGPETTLKVLLNFIDHSLVPLHSNTFNILVHIVATRLRTFRSPHACEVYPTTYR